jgi:hypothetical protein
MGAFPNPAKMAKSMMDSASRAVAKLFDQKAFDAFTQAVIAYVEKSNEVVNPHVAVAMKYEGDKDPSFFQFSTPPRAPDETLFTLWKYKQANERLYALLKARGALALGRTIEKWGPDEVLAGIAVNKLRAQADRIQYGLVRGGFYARAQRTWFEVWDPLFKQERAWFTGQITDAVLSTLPAFNWFLNTVNQIGVIVRTALDGAQRLANAGKSGAAAVEDGMKKLEELMKRLEGLKAGGLALGMGSVFLVGGAILLGVAVFGGVKGLK